MAEANNSVVPPRQLAAPAARVHSAARVLQALPSLTMSNSHLNSAQFTANPNYKASHDK
jgi:hypothetical protein